MVVRYLMTRTWMSALGLVLAGAAATFGYVVHYTLGGCSGEVTLQGANIDVACLVIAISGAAALLALAALALAKEKGQGLAVLLFLEAGALLVAIGSVLADSARYVIGHASDSCYYPGDPTVVSHVYGLIAVLCVTVPLLLLRAFGAWTGVERLGPAQRRRRSDWAVPS